MSAQIARRVVEAFQPKPPVENPNTQLSPRESEIIQLLACGHLYKEIADRLKLSVEGKTNPEIAQLLGTSRRTMDKHVEHILAKLRVETRAAAARVGRTHAAKI